MTLKEKLQAQAEKRNAKISKRNEELEKIKARLDALEKINDTSDDEEELKAASAELDELKAKKAELEADKAELEAELEEVNAAIAELDKPEEEQPKRNKFNFMTKESRGTNNMNIEERTKLAEEFVKTRKTVIQNEELRSVLVSSGNIATPTEVGGINPTFNGVSSIIDLVKVVNCVGMGSNKVAYQIADATAAAQTEGSAANSSDPTFGFVTITPTSVAVLSAISKQAKRQSPLQYETKVKESAMNGLRKQVAKIVTDAIVASTLTTAVTVAALNETAIRDIALNYGGAEGVEGEAYLFLNKADLITLGKVRGTNEKKAVFEIMPNAANPNTGTIKDGGLVVNYCINSNLTEGTLLYGNPKNIELDLFSNYEIAVSEDFYFDKLMDAIRGDVELGADVVAKDGLVKVTVGA